jgi:ABC-type spermidine/putrescine transport system permease subunit I
MAPGLIRSRWLPASLLIAPAVLTIAFFMLAPLGLMGVVSFLEKGINGGVRWGSYTVEPYVQFLFERDLDDSLILNSDYVQIFWRSIWLSIITTILALAIGFPTALYMALQPPNRRNLLVFLVTIPFWTNLLVRNYSWILLLRTNGLVNNLLVWLFLPSFHGAADLRKPREAGFPACRGGLRPGRGPLDCAEAHHHPLEHARHRRRIGAGIHPV